MSTRLNIILIWLTFISLLIAGLVMVASTSPYAPHNTNSDLFNPLIRQQTFLALVGLIGACVISRIDYRILKKLVIPIWIFCVILLALCYCPGIGKTINGESRWIGIGAATFQPSEIAKIGIMVCTAHWYSVHKELAASFTQGLLIPGLIFGIPVVLILCEKDMGTAAALSLSGFCLMYTAGARWWMLLLSLLMGCLLLYVFTTSSENRMIRIDAWWDIEGSKLGAGRQQWLSTIAFARGGLSGAGLGNGLGKIGSIPEAHTDFIFATLGEELGLIGSGGILFLFMLFAIAGLRLAAATQERFGKLLVVSFTCVITWPAMLNIMVVSAVVPNTGLPLPFISYGGTNLLLTILSIGIITSVYIHSPQKKPMYWPKKKHLNHLNKNA